jgi:hypothetical protein
MHLFAALKKQGLSLGFACNISTQLEGVQCTVNAADGGPSVSGNSSICFMLPLKTSSKPCFNLSFHNHTPINTEMTVLH